MLQKLFQFQSAKGDAGLTVEGVAQLAGSLDARAGELERDDESWRTVTSELAGCVLAGAGAPGTPDCALRALLSLTGSAPTTAKRDIVFQQIAQVVDADQLQSCAELTGAVGMLASTVREAAQYASSTDARRLLERLSALVVGIARRVGDLPMGRAGELLVDCCCYLLDHDSPQVQADGVRALWLLSEQSELIGSAAQSIEALLPRFCAVLRDAAACASTAPPLPARADAAQHHTQELKRQSSGDLGADDDLGMIPIDIPAEALVAAHPPDTLRGGLVACRNLCSEATLRDELVRLKLSETVATVLLADASLRSACCEALAAAAAAAPSPIDTASDVLYDDLFTENAVHALIVTMQACSEAYDAVLLTRVGCSPTVCSSSYLP